MEKSLLISEQALRELMVLFKTLFVLVRTVGTSLMIVPQVSVCLTSGVDVSCPCKSLSLKALALVFTSTGISFPLTLGRLVSESLLLVTTMIFVIDACLTCNVFVKFLP